MAVWAGMHAMHDDDVQKPQTPSSGAWIDPELYYHGDEPPPGDAWSASDWIEVPHESHIAIAKSRLDEVITAESGAESERIKHLLRLIEGLIHFHHHDTLNQLKRDYQLFTPEGGKLQREGLGEDELLERQRMFVGNFLRTMVKGNFLPFGDRDFERAAEQSYLLDVPVDIQWDRHDAELIGDFIEWADSEDGRELRDDLGIDGSVRDYLALPRQVGTNAMVFYCGIDRDQAEGRFLGQRLDILVDRLIKVVTFPIVAPVQALVQRSRTAARQAPPPGTQPADQARTTLFERRWVRRKNLRNTPLLGGMLRPRRLQEPAFRQVIILFRERPDVRDGSFGGLVRKRSAPKESRDWNIHLKMFHHIPMADAEIVFPYKKMRMGAFDMAVLTLSTLAAVPAAASALVKGSSAGWAIAIALGVFIAKVVGRYMRVRSKYMARMTRNLYEKNLDNSLGVLQYLVDALEEQEYKEAVLAYFVLWREGRAMSASELDAAIERFVHREFSGLEVDFEIGDALRKVSNDASRDRTALLPIVVAEGDPEALRYRAVPLDEALRVLDQTWDNLFQFNV